MRYRIALCGFSEFEHRAMHFSFQHPAGFSESAFDLVDALVDADFAVVDADSSSAVKGVVQSGRVAQAVFVGVEAPPGAGSHLPRPIDTNRIVRSLQELIGRKLKGDHHEKLGVDNALSETVISERVIPNKVVVEKVLITDPKRSRAGAPSIWDLPTLEDVIATELPEYDPEAPTEPTPLAPDADIAPPTAAPAPAAAPAAEPPAAPAAAPASPAKAPSDAKAAARAAARKARLANAASNAQAVQQPRDVLVLDADPVAGESLCVLLERFGFEAVPVATLNAAYDEIRKKPFAALFLDMPLDDDGILLLQAVRSLKVPAGRAAAVVFMVTAQPDPANRVRAALAGVGEPLVKPLQRGIVARALENNGVTLPADARRT